MIDMTGKSIHAYSTKHFITLFFSVGIDVDTLLTLNPILAVRAEMDADFNTSPDPIKHTYLFRIAHIIIFLISSLSKNVRGEN